MMKGIVGLGMLGLIGVMGWQLGERLSSDAIGMALGVLFGIMAGIPAALMVLTARRHDERDRDEMPRRRRQQMHAYGYQQYQPQPPVIVVTGMPGQQGGYGQQQAGYPPNYGGQLALPGAVEQPAYRDFRVVGENEEVLDPW